MYCTVVSGKIVAFIFGAEEQTKQETNMKQAASNLLVSCEMFLRNVSLLSMDYMVLYSKRQKCSKSGY
jgi:hypothetical protein